MLPAAIIYARGSQRGIGQPQMKQIGRIIPAGSRHRHRPARETHRGRPRRQVAAGIHQARPRLGQQIGRPLRREPLGNAPQVQARPHRQPQRPPLRVQRPGFRPGARRRTGCRQGLAVRVWQPPQLIKGAVIAGRFQVPKNGRVKKTAGRFGHHCGLLQHLPQNR